MPFAGTWMDLEIVIVNEVGQTEKDKYYMILLICRILKKKGTNKVMDVENKVKVTKGEWEREGISWETGQ